MNQNLSQTFLAITRNSTDLEWLQGAQAPVILAGRVSRSEAGWQCNKHCDG